MGAPIPPRADCRRLRRGLLVALGPAVLLWGAIIAAVRAALATDLGVLLLAATPWVLLVVVAALAADQRRRPGPPLPARYEIPAAALLTAVALSHVLGLWGDA